MQMLLYISALACRLAWFMVPAAFSAYPAGVLASISALLFPAAPDAPETRGGCTAFPSSGQCHSPAFHMFSTATLSLRSSLTIFPTLHSFLSGTAAELNFS